MAEFPDIIILGSSLTYRLKDRINAAFGRLNEEGQQKAVESVEIIAGNPKYQRTPTPESTPAPPEGTDTTPPPDAPETPSEGE